MVLALRLEHILLRLVKCHKTNYFIDLCLHYAGLYQYSVNINHDIFLLSSMFGGGLLSVSFKDSRGITCRRTLRQWKGNFPLAISTTFTPACASYFLSSSACFLLCHSYCSSITIVPSLLKRDIVHCEVNIQSVSSHPRMYSQE